ncbi:MAG: hypothetical protein ACPHN3_02215 [Spongiibacter sp.]
MNEPRTDTLSYPLSHTLSNTLSHTQAPADLVMPALPQLITTVAYGIGAVIFVIYALYLSKRHRSAVPLLLLLGSVLTLYLEPVVDLLGNAVHPQIAQYNVLTTNGHPVPLAVLVGYIWYFAALPLLCFDKIRARTLKQNFVWKSYAAVVLTAALVEQIPLHFGVWVYYGYQPFKLGYMPSWWFFVNTTAVIVPFLLTYALIPKLKGLKQIALVLIMPSGAFMGHAAAGWPMYNALGTDTLNFPQWIIQGSSLLSVLLSLLVVWVVMAIIDLPRR